VHKPITRSAVSNDPHMPPLKRVLKMTSANKESGDRVVEREITQNKVKFEIYGEEMIEKKVKSSGNSGRVYLPPNWVGHQVKIIRID